MLKIIVIFLDLNTLKSSKRNFFKEIYLYRGMIWLFIRSNLGIFLLRKFGVVLVYIELPGVVIWQHIHPSTLHSY